MRMSDWSSDVCSSDLGIQVDVWGKFLRNDEPPCELLVVLFGALVSQQRERRISHHGPVHRLTVRRVAQTCGALRILEYVHGCLAEPRSEERRVGKGCLGKCRVGGARSH